MVKAFLSFVTLMETLGACGTNVFMDCLRKISLEIAWLGLGVGEIIFFKAKLCVFEYYYLQLFIYIYPICRLHVCTL